MLLSRNLIITVFILFTCLQPAAAQVQQNATSAKQAILIDYETGTILLEKNADERMPTSSMSKIMTMLLVFDALKSGRLSLDTELPVSEKAWRMQGSKMFVEVGRTVRVEDLIHGVLVQSGNDATIVLAEGLAGTEEAFSEAMTAKAKKLGMKNSNFTNASGWPDENHYSSARDLSILARHVIHEYPEYFPYFSVTEFTFSAIKQRNRNPLLYRNIGADGMKTGHTEAGGYGLVGTGTKNGRRVILVVNGISDDKERANEASRLLDWGLSGFANVKLAAAGETITKAKVVLGKSSQAPLTVSSDLAVTVPALKTDEVRLTANYKKPLVAPLIRGQEVGTLIVEVPNMEAMNIPLVVASDIPQKAFFPRTLAKAHLFFFGSGK